MKIVFATNNAHKLDEIRKILGTDFELLSLHDIGCDEDIAETGSTLNENALIKAQYIFDKYHYDVFADDTGLEVEALNGEPGVYSARYAGGEGHDSEANMTKLLAKMEGTDNRKARFRTVICLIQNRVQEGQDRSTNYFEGIVEGHIATERHGDGGPFWRSVKGQPVSAMTPSSNPKATNRPLPNWATTSRTASATGQGP